MVSVQIYKHIQIGQKTKKSREGQNQENTRRQQVRAGYKVEHTESRVVKKTQTEKHRGGMKQMKTRHKRRKLFKTKQKINSQSIQ